MNDTDGCTCEDPRDTCASCPEAPNRKPERGTSMLVTSAPPGAMSVATALDHCTELLENMPGDDFDREAIAVLRVHLSRLREEARFRDAAMAFFRFTDKVLVKGVSAAEEKNGEALLLRCQETFRALEEPRDG